MVVDLTDKEIKRKGMGDMGMNTEDYLEKQEFNLSEKRNDKPILNLSEKRNDKPTGGYGAFYYEEDVREFVRLLKEGCIVCGKYIVRGKGKENKSGFCHSCLTSLSDMSPQNKRSFLKNQLFAKINKLAGKDLS